jgi:hypothetical protein
MWKKLWPKAVNDIRDFTVENNAINAKNVTVDMAQQTGFEINRENVDWMLEFEWESFWP